MGSLFLGILNLINFKEEIPHSVFIYINQDDGDEYVFVNIMINKFPTI